MPTHTRLVGGTTEPTLGPKPILRVESRTASADRRSKLNRVDRVEPSCAELMIAHQRCDSGPVPHATRSPPTYRYGRRLTAEGTGTRCFSGILGTRLHGPDPPSDDQTKNPTSLVSERARDPIDGPRR